MLAFLLEARRFWESGTVYPFAVFMALVWMLWLIRVALARRYRPWRGHYATTASVIIPVVDEPADLFRDVLARIARQRPLEVIVVINGDHNPVLEAECDAAGVRRMWTPVPGKRGAVRLGVEAAAGDIVVLVDSDTIWADATLGRDGTLPELLRPFADPRVGGVTTRQRILDPRRNVLTRWADWLESVRATYSLPAMSVLGTVGCLPGRTIAFRRSILLDCMDAFCSERFLGVFLEVSDDRTLTNYCLKAGYQTVYQATSLVYTDAPTNLRKLARQQLRWARGSQYNTLRMLPWMIRRAPLLALFYVSDIVVPFVLIGAYASWVYAIAAHSRADVYDDLPLPVPHWAALPALIGVAAIMTTLSLGLRFGRYFAYRPHDIVFLPAFMAINTGLLMPTRMIGFFRLAHNSGWGTRTGGFAGEKERNPKVVVPYLLGFLMLAGAVMLSVQA